MAKARVGKLAPRYKFLLNPHEHLRYSACPICDKQTFPRKFALFVHVMGAPTSVIVGKTCKYCSRSELIICHQDELDEVLTRLFERLNPQLIGNEYLVLGTMDMNAWKKSLAQPMNIEQTIEHLADFKKHVRYDIDPGGWRHEDADPARFIIKHSVAEARRQTPWTAPLKDRAAGPVSKP